VKPTQYNKSDFSKGERVYLLIIPLSNAARHIQNKEDIESWIIETTIVSIGKRYISVEYQGEKFDTTNEWRHYHLYGGENYILVKTKQEAYDKMLADRLYKKLKSYFGYSCQLSLEQLKAIYEILGITYKL
jgi:hypothetical protein